MWIMNQAKTKMINTNNVVGIYIDNAGHQIRASLVGIDDVCVLGIYDKMEDCENVLAAILLTASSGKVTYITLPRADGVEKFMDEFNKILI